MQETHIPFFSPSPIEVWTSLAASFTSAKLQQDSYPLLLEKNAGNCVVDPNVATQTPCVSKYSRVRPISNILFTPKITRLLSNLYFYIIFIHIRSVANFPNKSKFVSSLIVFLK